MTRRLYAKYLARKAQDLVADPSNWIRGYTLARDLADNAVPYYDTAATKFNDVGALESRRPRSTKGNSTRWGFASSRIRLNWPSV